MVDALGFVFRQPQKIQHARKSLGNVMGVLGRAYSDGIKKLNYQAWGHGMWEIGVMAAHMHAEAMPCTARLTVRQRQPSWPKQGRRPARRAPSHQLEASNPIETRCHEVGDLSLTIATFINSHVHVSTHTHVSPLASP